MNIDIRQKSQDFHDTNTILPRHQIPLPSRGQKREKQWFEVNLLVCPSFPSS